MSYMVHAIDLYALNSLHLITKRGLKMHNQKITMIFASILGISMLGVMACTLWLLFTGSAIELVMGILASAVSVYAFIDVSNDLN